MSPSPSRRDARIKAVNWVYSMYLFQMYRKTTEKKKKKPARMTENIFGVVFVHFARGLVAHSVTPSLKWTPSATRKPASSFPSTSVARPPPTLIWARLVRLQYCKSGFEDKKGSNFRGSNMDRKRKLVCSWGFFPPSGFFSLPSHGICEGEPRKCGPSHFATWKINRENNNNNNNKQICEAIFSPR